MTLLFAMLSLVSIAGAVGVVGAMVARSSRRTAAVELGAYTVPVAATVATVAMLGSLYMSEVAGFIPCRLCWVQRFFMYPLAVFLIVSAARRWRWVAVVGLPVSIIGALIAAYHYAEQRMWLGGSEGFCDAASPCTDVWVQHFGFVTIPFMSFTGFIFVAALLWLRTAANTLTVQQTQEI